LESFVTKLLLLLFLFDRHDGNVMLSSLVDSEILELVQKKESLNKSHLFWPNKVCIARLGPSISFLDQETFILYSYTRKLLFFFDCVLGLLIKKRNIYIYIYIYIYIK